MGIALVCRLGVLVAGALAVSGCGGSSTGGGPSYSEITNRIDGLFASIDSDPTANMPVGGTARYRGGGELFISGSPSGNLDGDLAGTVNLTADFANDTISGKMGQFRSFTDQRINGALDIRVGDIVGNEIFVEMDGRLSANGVSVDFDLLGGGTFRGPGARFLIVGLDGFAVSGGEVANVDGGFIAEQR